MSVDKPCFTLLVCFFPWWTGKKKYIRDNTEEYESNDDQSNVVDAGGRDFAAVNGYENQNLHWYKNKEENNKGEGEDDGDDYKGDDDDDDDGDGDGETLEYVEFVEHNEEGDDDHEVQVAELIPLEVVVVVEHDKKDDDDDEVQAVLSPHRRNRRSEKGRTRRTIEYSKGTIIRKKFDDGNHYDGEIISYDKEKGWYKIMYEDGDGEEMSHDDVTKYYKHFQSYEG